MPSERYWAAVSVNGPLLERRGAEDYEGEGRERYWNTPRDRRAEQVARILELTLAGNSEMDRRFANGWLSERERDRRAIERSVGGTLACSRPLRARFSRCVEQRGVCD